MTSRLMTVLMCILQDLVLCEACEKYDPPQGSSHLSEHVLMKIKRGKKEIDLESQYQEAQSVAASGHDANEEDEEEKEKGSVEERLSAIEKLLAKIAAKLEIESD